MKTWIIPERRPAMAGPWYDEPDKAHWIDETTGYDCLIVRNHLGALCGYVGVPPEHPWHGKDYDAVYADVHGGLTYADRCQEDEEHGICHVPEPGRPDDVWWLGFDCAHLGDLVPGAGRVSPYETYRELNYVRGEVAGLARQAAEAAR